MSMKLAFIGGKYPDTLEETARLAADVGYEGLEFDYWSEFEELITDDVVSRMQTILQRHGVGVAAYGLWGYNHLSPDADERAHAHETLDRAIGYAEQLGAHALVLATGDMPDEPVERKLDEFAKVFAPILKRIADAVTTSDDETLQGVINVNTAPVQVLACLRGVEEELAVQIADARPETGFQSIGDLLDVPGLTTEVFKQMCGSVSVRSDVFGVQSFGVLTAPDGTLAACCCVWAVIDVTGDQVKLNVWRELR